MNKNDFRNPLIQSGAVLLFVFLLISIVANTGPNGMMDSIAALFSGLFYGLLFLVALCFAIIVSIAIIIALFFAAVSIHSVDRARDMYSGLKGSLCSMYGTFTEKYGTFTAKRTRSHTTVSSDPASTVSGNGQVDGTELAGSLKSLQNRLAQLEASLTDVRNAQAAADSRLNSLAQEINDLQETTSLTDLRKQYDTLAEGQQGLLETTHGLATSLEASSGRLADLENTYMDDRSKVRAEIDTLRQKTSIPEVVTGILSYIDRPEDREKITEKAEEAVSRGMTYAQIDAFFKSSLPAHVHKVLAEHPRLTKDFLRSIKKKFA